MEPSDVNSLEARLDRILTARRRVDAELSYGQTDHRKMQADDLPVLYVKTGCPWCQEAIEFMDSHGVSYRVQNVSENPDAMMEMQKKSGQTRAPTLDWHGKILADFGVDELVPFLRKQEVKLEDN
jgi:glutaredoxin 3